MQETSGQRGFHGSHTHSDAGRVRVTKVFQAHIFTLMQENFGAPKFSRLTDSLGCSKTSVPRSFLGSDTHADAGKLQCPEVFQAHILTRLQENFRIPKFTRLTYSWSCRKMSVPRSFPGLHTHFDAGKLGGTEVFQAYILTLMHENFGAPKFSSLIYSL